MGIEWLLLMPAGCWLEEQVGGRRTKTKVEYLKKLVDDEHQRRRLIVFVELMACATSSAGLISIAITRR